MEDICSGFALLDGGTVTDAGDLHGALRQVHKFQIALDRTVVREDIPFDCLSFETEGRVARFIVRGDTHRRKRRRDARGTTRAGFRTIKEGSMTRTRRRRINESVTKRANTRRRYGEAKIFA